VPDASNALVEVTLVLRAGAPAYLDRLGEALLRGEAPPEVGDRATLRRALETSPRDIDCVCRFARRHDLEPGDINPIRNTVIIGGSARKIAAAFPGELASHKLGGAAACRQSRERSGVSPEIIEVVEAVLGLGDCAIAGRACQCGSERSLRAFTPPDVARLYRFPRGRGFGETVGIIAFDGQVDQAELVAYREGLGINAAPSVTTVAVDGGNPRAGERWRPDHSELMFNLEIAASVAPGARIVVYLAPNTTAGVINALTSAIHDDVHRPSILSVSWGRAESLWAPQALRVVNHVLRAAALLGITVLCATGNLGSSDGIEDGNAHVDFPASSPFVLACGGSSLRASNDLILSETAWVGSGGGFSEKFTLPAYQAGCVVPFADNLGRGHGRGIPDVAAHADFARGYRMHFDGVDRLMAGTSAVPPLYAALIAIINERTGRPTGFVNPLLYREPRIAPTVRDIVQGRNGDYSAGPGWDACTGLGSLNGVALLRTICADAKLSTRSGG
jgi:kumamolisin